MSDFTPPRVKFRYEFVVRDEETRNKVMNAVSWDFTNFMRSVSISARTHNDYKSLPKLRDFVTKNPDLSDITQDLIEKLDGDLTKRLMKIGPAYNMCSTDMKAFILLSIGFKL